MGKLQARLGEQLSIWIRHLAWLSATPKPDPKTKRGQQQDLELVSRIEGLRRQGIKSPPMPDNPAPKITDWLVEMGLTEAAGMSAVPLSWREINAWCDRTCVDLLPWEARLIRRLSSDYLAESRKAESETCPAPWLAPASDVTIAAEMHLLDSILG